MGQKYQIRIVTMYLCPVWKPSRRLACDEANRNVRPFHVQNIVDLRAFLFNRLILRFDSVVFTNMTTGKEMLGHCIELMQGNVRIRARTCKFDD